MTDNRQTYIEYPNKKVTQAQLIAQAAHLGELDKGGTLYIYHPLHVAAQFTDDTYKIVALLHDVIEDSQLTSIDRLQLLFGLEVSQAVDAISRKKGEMYFDYISRCKENKIACAVKIEDIKHNMDRTRWQLMPDSYYKREQKALKILQDKVIYTGEFCNVDLIRSEARKIVIEEITAHCNRDHKHLAADVRAVATDVAMNEMKSHLCIWHDKRSQIKDKIPGQDRGEPND